jgi:hypothetical protein
MSRNDRFRFRPQHISLHRMHFREDGQPKQRLGKKAAAIVRRRGWMTYLCPICGGTHASSKYAPPKSARRGGSEDAGADEPATRGVGQ